MSIEIVIAVIGVCLAASQSLVAWLSYLTLRESRKAAVSAGEAAVSAWEAARHAANAAASAKVNQ